VLLFLLTSFVVLFNLLVAMTSSTYSRVFEKSREEYLMVRTITMYRYNAEERHLPPPLNVIPLVLAICLLPLYCLGFLCFRCGCCSSCLNKKRGHRTSKFGIDAGESLAEEAEIKLDEIAQKNSRNLSMMIELPDGHRCFYCHRLFHHWSLSNAGLELLSKTMSQMYLTGFVCHCGGSWPFPLCVVLNF